MTAVVGLVDGVTVVIGGDSAAVSGYDLRVRRDPKVFTVGPYLVGFAGSFRIGQLLRFAFNPPLLADGPADLDRFMATEWIDALRKCLKDGGAAKKNSEVEEGGTFLVGVRGRLFEVHGDYQVGEPADGYTAVGCGDNIALGALHATAGLGMVGEARVRAALAAAERHSAGVRGPFTVVRESQ